MNYDKEILLILFLIITIVLGATYFMTNYTSNVQQEEGVVEIETEQDLQDTKQNISTELSEIDNLFDEISS